MKTVADLRAALKGLPGNTPVIINTYDSRGFSKILTWDTEVSDCFVLTDKTGNDLATFALVIEPIEDEE